MRRDQEGRSKTYAKALEECETAKECDYAQRGFCTLSDTKENCSIHRDATHEKVDDVLKKMVE